ERITRVGEDERRRLALHVGQSRLAEQARQLPADGTVAEVAITPEVLDLAQQIGVGKVGDQRLLVGIDGDEPPPDRVTRTSSSTASSGPATCWSARSMRVPSNASSA